MAEITCPQCGSTFPIDESDYTTLLSHVRDDAFKSELAEREALAEEKHQAQLSEATEKLRRESSEEIASLKAALKAAEEKADSAVVLALAKQEKDLNERISKLEADLREGKANAESAAKIAEIEKERSKAEFEAQLAQTEASSKAVIQAKDEEIERLRDMKARLSTKMIGETLEQHCEIEFAKLHAYAFPNAIFGKDNTAIEGTKGDYIFRETSEDGVELLSIMFEMKNEADTTQTKHKNSDFFEKLDKDRKKKNCEYAILVSLLEPDSDLYNQGIVEVPDFEKMYVIRPQFFVPIIGLLRNMALRSLADRQALELLRQRDQDVTNFEDKLTDFRNGIFNAVTKANGSFEAAIKEIEKAIRNLEATKKKLETTMGHLNTANNRAQDLTIRKLTYKNPTMAAKFKQARELKSAEESTDGPDIEILAPHVQDGEPAETRIETIEILDMDSSEEPTSSE